MAEAKVVVIGAGMGGLVSALLLAARGLDVTVLEAADGPGGKMRPLQVAGLSLDAGPTVFTMRWVFDELLQEVGSSVAQALPPMQPLSVLARHAWGADGSRLDLLADRQAAADAIGNFAGAAEARRYLDFCAEAARVYGRLEGPHIRSSRPSLLQMVADLGPKGLATLTGLGPLATLSSALHKRFKDPRMQQLFARYATYCGSSPWQAPATLMLVAHVEQAGVWAVQGGMAALAAAMAALVKQRGGVLRYGARCQSIESRQGQVSAVHLVGGERVSADAVVFNGDVQALPALLSAGPGQPKPAQANAAARARRSLSALTWNAVVPTSGFELARHNVFFDADYASEFSDIFKHRRLPRQGTVYVCAQDRLDGEPAPTPNAVVTPANLATQPSAPERLLLLVNAPADGDTHEFDNAELDACETRSLALLDRCGLKLQLDSKAQVVRRTPADFHQLFPATGGALYGPASHSWMAVFQRASASTPLPGLFLAGGSVHPGPGVPMAAMSGRLAAASLMAHLGSTRQLHRVRISGGMSTPSATTAATR